MTHDSDIDFSALREVFRLEASELLDSLEQSVLALEANPSDAAPVEAMFRAAHTIKGGARMVGYQGVAEFTHTLEDVLDALRQGKIGITRGLTTLLLRSGDSLRLAIAAAMAGEESARPEQAELKAALIAAVTGGGLSEVTQEQQAELMAPAPASREDGSAEQSHAQRTIRVSVDKLDRLLDIVGEIAVARGRMTDMLESRTEQVRSVLLESHREADLLYMDLQELAMKLRMVPLGPLFHEYVRAVRDTAIASGKSARLFIEGDDVEVDTAVVEHLRDPLMHLVRNAVHHGIEDSLRRTEVGKPAVGRVVLRAERRGGSILVEVSDDGAGLDRERIASIARERGLVGTGELTNAEIDRLILLPGFSTAQEVTELSGRGVGMDVVVRNIETLRGSITVDSTPGQGSTFSLHLPLTLAIIEGFRIAVADEVYVVPMESVVECVELPRRDRRDKLAWGVTELRGTPLPYIDLRRTFGLPGETPARESLLVVRRDEREAGIAVDELLGSAQVVIKPLGRLFQRVSGLSGTAIMGNGRPAFVLDIPALLDGVLRRFSEWSQGQKEQRMAHEALHE